MPRNGSGQYIPPDSTWNPATPNVTILSGDWNDLLSDMALAITNSMATDGQSTFSAQIPFAQGLSVNPGSLGTPSISVIGDPNTGMYQPAADQWAIVAGGFQALRAASTGITLPLALTVSGATNLFGLLTVAGAFAAAANATIGTTAANTLTVNATSTFNGPATFTTITVPDGTWANTKLATMATQTFKGRTTAGTGAPEDLTSAQAAAILPVFTPDAGAGGVKGSVPAPAAGTTAAKAYLGADGTFSNELKAWGLFTGSSGATVASRNLSCVRNSASNFTFTFGTALANANYVLHITPTTASANPFFQATVSSKLAGSFVIQTVALVGATPGGEDPLQINITVFA